MKKWLEIRSDNISELERVSKEFNIHPLVLEDCINRNQRPKLEDFGTHQFLVWFMMAEGSIYEIQFIIFPDFILIVPHESPPNGQLTWKEYFKLQDSHQDVWHQLYHALDHATDITWNEVKNLFLKVDDFEEQIFQTGSDPQSILALKKHLIKVDYSMGHLTSVVTQLQDFSRSKTDLNWKLRDLHDHCERVFRSISLCRSQITATIELFWGYQSHKLNKHIKNLSLLASVAVPLTFWASFWGMNFEAIPFHSNQLFLLALFLMFGSVAFTAWFLKKQGYWND
ncbi:MAG: CorA family divalent cation transporter [Bdellovibrionota bacterium]